MTTPPSSSPKYSHFLEQPQCETSTNAFRKHLQELFSTPTGQIVLETLKKHFEINLPVFQGKKGNFDPLDAMRRDAYREVFLFIDYELQQNNSPNKTAPPHTTQ